MPPAVRVRVAAGGASRVSGGKSGHLKAVRLVKARDARLQGRADGKCHRKHTARKGKGEKVG